MKKSKVKVLHWIPMGMFPATVCFSCGFSYDELIKNLKKTKADEWEVAISLDKKLIDDGNAFALERTCENVKTGKTKKFYFIVMKESFGFTDYQYCVLAHEILHICQFFLPGVLDRTKELESEAYLHTYLMEQCLKSIRGTK